jgi:glutathione S-transferase
MTASRLPQLFSSVRSPHCLKVSMVLHEKEIAFERVEIDLKGGQQKTAAYRAINPLGQVPVYRDDVGTHIDSLAIMRYLDERFPRPRLFPDEPELLAAVLDWIELSSTSYRDVSHHLYWQLLEPPSAGPDATTVEELTHTGRSLLVDLDRALAAGGGWVTGSLTVADISLFVWVQGFRRFGDRFALAGGDELRHVRAWLERLATGRSFTVSAGVPGRPFDAAID